MKIPKYKKGDIVLGRVICEVVPCLDFAGKPSFRYGYKYEHESDNISLLWCQESTIIRKMYL